MSFSFPSVLELSKRIKADIDRHLSTSGRSLHKSVTGAISKALAGAIYLLYQHQQYSLKQFFVTTASIEFLLIWGAIFKIPRKEAGFAKGNIKIKGLDAVVIPNGTELKIDGETFLTQSQVAIGSSVSGEVVVEVEAQSAGVSGNILEGEELIMASTIEGVENKAAVQEGGISGGTEVEDVEAYRERILELLQNPPMGGAKRDYIIWSKRISGVTRAWVFQQYLGKDNAVGVAIVDDSSDPITPNSAKVSEVQAYLESDEIKPVGADVTVFAPTAQAMDLDISLNPNTEAVRATIEASIKSLISREAEVGGASGADGTIYLSRLNEAISSSVGEFDHKINTINLAAPANISPELAKIITLGDITWQSL